MLDLKISQIIIHFGKNGNFWYFGNFLSIDWLFH